MEHSTCFAGGLFALGSLTFYNDSRLEAKHLQLGKDLALSCHESYRRSATGLGPESFQFDSVPREDATSRQSDSKAYRLRPDVVETYLILWRLTQDQKYRDWGWEVVEALEKYCRTKFGFAGLQNVYDPNGSRDGVQGSHFLSETLKFLYLLFSKDSLLPLKKWVFNTAGHPLPVRYINNKFRGTPQALCALLNLISGLDFIDLCFPNKENPWLALQNIFNILCYFISSRKSYSP